MIAVLLLMSHDAFSREVAVILRQGGDPQLTNGSSASSPTNLGLSIGSKGLFDTLADCEKSRPEHEMQFANWFRAESVTSNCIAVLGNKESFALKISGQQLHIPESHRLAQRITISPPNKAVRETVIDWLKSKELKFTIQFVEPTSTGGIFYVTKPVYLDHVYLNFRTAEECTAQEQKMIQLFNRLNREFTQICTMTNIGRDIYQNETRDLEIHSLVISSIGQQSYRKRIIDQAHSLQTLRDCLDHLENLSKDQSQSAIKPENFFCSFEKQSHFSYRIVEITF